MLPALLDIALDLTTSLPTTQRYERLLHAVRRIVPCDAAALLRWQGGRLVPLSVQGLSAEVLGMRFDPAEHPRLEAIVSARGPVRFAAADQRPDPYDGLVLEADAGELHVHACMGAPLHVGGELVGALTVDALEPGRFDAVDDPTLATLAALAGAAMRTAGLIEALEEVAAHREQVAHALVLEALTRDGGDLLGRSAAMERLRGEIRAVAGSDVGVLVSGETGVGKELVARTLHATSRRAHKPLVHVNCAALPESIAESELFGHVKGAFTGAVDNRAGKLELAHEGTLFLDEIGELPLSIQPLLLRALQFGELQRVGSDAERKVDVRVIAATNRDLAAEVKAGRFRADLFHRLSVFPIHVPPLRERDDDVELLAGYFLDRARARLGRGPFLLAPDARAALRRYPWPGNVRELEHTLLGAALRAPRSDDGPIEIAAAHLGLDAPSLPLPPEPLGEAQPKTMSARPVSLLEATAAFQRELILDAVRAANGNWSKAARTLDVDRSNLHRMAKRLGLKSGA